MTAVERFLNYIKIDTTSDSSKERTPSTEGQNTLAKYLVEELVEMGITNENGIKNMVYDQEYGYLYVRVLGNSDLPSIGFVAHLDTSESASGKNIRPKIIENYDGEDIKLNEFTKLSPDTYPDLKNHIGKTLITTDGTTLLGADDKAGIAEIMQMLEYYSKTDEKHGEIIVCFTPDEEIGRGTSHIDYSIFNPKFAYTVDGSSLGEISYENFNAATATITIEGVPTHTGSAKGIMENSLKAALDIDLFLPDDEVPERTEGYQGFFHLQKITGTVAKTQMTYLIRDFEKELLEQRVEELEKVIETIRTEYNDIPIKLDVTYSYNNMYEIIKEHPELIDKTKKVMKENDIDPITKPIRGGTDGVDISFNGIPCPNLGTGGHNFHSVYEYIAVEDIEQTTNLLISIVKEFSKDNNKQMTK